MKIGGKDKDGGSVCFKNELFVGKKPTSLGQTVQDENDWKPREDKDFQEQKNQKCLCTNILEVMKMTEGKDLAVCFKKALFLFKILLHASPIPTTPDGNGCGQTWNMSQMAQMALAKNYDFGRTCQIQVRVFTKLLV